MPTQPTFTCATCDAEIAHHPVFHLGLAFCCAGCAADGPCMCSYDMVVAPAAVHEIPIVPRATIVEEPVAVTAVSPDDTRRVGDERRRAAGRRLVDVRG